MKEYLNCEACNAIIDISMLNCDYCGSNLKTSSKNAEILKQKVEIDGMLLGFMAEEALQYIALSNYSDHPIIRYRKIKANLLICLFCSAYVDSHEFCELMEKVEEISKYSNEYKNDFVAYLSSLIPSIHVKVLFSDFQGIVSFLETTGVDDKGDLTIKFSEQFLITELGSKFMKEYLFYTNKKNFVNNPDFIRKKQNLENKFTATRKKYFDK